MKCFKPRGGHSCPGQIAHYEWIIVNIPFFPLYFLIQIAL